MLDRQAQIEFILDHYEHPRNRGRLEDADVIMKGGNPGCGDVVTFYLKVHSETQQVTEVKWEGEGCTISQAAASLASEMVQGMTLDEVKALKADDLIDVLGREVVTARLRCATLGIHTAKAAVRKYEVERLLAQIDADRVESPEGQDLGLEFEPLEE
ncbi:MAG: iron-sulfur cluster assembly scaffold protein [Ardenticatenia bacterium]|nr:iron-sulfur cluster assembly scaffold protein [Ardenticatenia bacterium]